MRNLLVLFVVLLLSVTQAIAKDMRFIQVDGLKYSTGNEASGQKFEKIIQDINRQKNVEFVVFSGNNIAKPSRENLLGFIKQAKQLNCPYYVILGNKDINKQKHFGKSEYMKLLSKKVKTHRKILEPNYVFKKNMYVFIVVDGSKEFITNPSGYYRENTLTWLDKQLTLNSDKKVVILQHFPIVAPVQKESHYTYKSDEYLKMLSKHKNVKAIVAGHFGVNKEENFEDILHISTAEAPVYRIIDILNYETDNPMFWSTIKQ